MITKSTFMDTATIYATTGSVEIVTVTAAIDDDGSEIARRERRRVIGPTDDITGEPLKIRQICQIARS